ncbi:MAG: tripartite tricarboxylate transporter TctB family protein [Pseudomonadota bacterium]
MALDRWIALVILVISLVYGYAAFFTLDAGLPPFMQRNPIWPSTFPKILAVLSALCALGILLGLEKSQSNEPKAGDIDYRRLGEYKLGQALLLLGLMVAYALLLRPAGFVLSTIGFLALGAIILGEKRYVILLVVAAIAAAVVWALVDLVLGIFLSPWPAFISMGG